MIAHLSKGGGLALQAFQLFRYVRDRAEARLLCLDAPGPHRHLLQEPGVEVVGDLRFPRGVWDLRRALRKARGSYDVVQVLDPYYATPAAALARARPRVLHWGTDPRTELAWRYGAPAGALYGAALRWFVGGGVLVANSAALAARFPKLRTVVIPNGIDLRAFESAPTRERARDRLGLPSERPVVLFVGKIIPVKRLEWFLEVARRVPEITGVAVGGYQEEHYGDAYLRQLRSQNPELGDRVRFVGEVPWEKVPEYMAAADLFLFPSKFEGMPNAVLEAMAAGLPVVASDIPPHREVLEDGVTGFIRTNPEAMAEAVSSLVRDPGLRRRLGDTARKHVRANYSQERCGERYMALYHEMVAGSRSR